MMEHIEELYEENTQTTQLNEKLQVAVARLKAENARLLAWQQEAEEVEDI